MPLNFEAFLCQMFLVLVTCRATYGTLYKYKQVHDTYCRASLSWLLLATMYTYSIICSRSRISSSCYRIYCGMRSIYRPVTSGGNFIVTKFTLLSDLAASLLKKTKMMCVVWIVDDVFQQCRCGIGLGKKVHTWRSRN